MYKWKPQNRNELESIIKDIIENQKNNPDYSYGLKNIDTSLITNMENLFSTYIFDKNSIINRQIDWNDPRNDITRWNVNQVTDMAEMFYRSSFNQDIGNWNISSVTNMFGMFVESKFKHSLWKWIDRLNENVNLYSFNRYSQHAKIFGEIFNIETFKNNQITPQQWIKSYRQSKTDKEKFELLIVAKQQNILNYIVINLKNDNLTDIDKQIDFLLYINENNEKIIQNLIKNYDTDIIDFINNFHNNKIKDTLAEEWIDLFIVSSENDRKLLLDISKKLDINDIIKEKIEIRKQQLNDIEQIEENLNNDIDI